MRCADSGEENIVFIDSVAICGAVSLCQAFD